VSSPTFKYNYNLLPHILPHNHNSHFEHQRLQCVLEESCICKNVLVYVEDLLGSDSDVDDFAVDTTEVSQMCKVLEVLAYSGV
jgi:hypothetical protein